MRMLTRTINIGAIFIMMMLMLSANHIASARSVGYVGCGLDTNKDGVVSSREDKFTVPLPNVTAPAGLEGMSPAYPKVTLEEHEGIHYTNMLRAEAGLPPMKLVPELALAARHHSFDMDGDGYMRSDHQAMDKVRGKLELVDVPVEKEGKTVIKPCKPQRRAETFFSYDVSYRENAYAGPSLGINAIIDDWSGENPDGTPSSPHHHKQYFRAEMQYSAVARTGGHAVQLFGDQYDGPFTKSDHSVSAQKSRPIIAPLLIINNEAPYTDSSMADVYIWGAWDEIRLKNNNGNWSRWKKLDPEEVNKFISGNTIPWHLGFTSGNVKVTAEVKRVVNGKTEAHTISDSIHRNTPNHPIICVGLEGNRIPGTDEPISYQIIGNGMPKIDRLSIAGIKDANTGCFDTVRVPKNGTYTVIVQSKANVTDYLTVKKSISLKANPAGTVSNLSKILIEGDTNGDNRIDVIDHSAFVKSYNVRKPLTESDPAYDSRTDFNEDGRIDIADFSRFVTNYNVNTPLTGE